MNSTHLTAEEFASLITTPILTPAGLEQARGLVSRTSKTSEFLAEHQAALIAAQLRWDSEAPVREAREEIRKAGWEKSQYDSKVWYNRKTKAKRSLVEAIREAGLAK